VDVSVGPPEPVSVGLPEPVSVGLPEPVSVGPPEPVGFPLLDGLPDPLPVVVVGVTLRLPVGLGDLDGEAGVDVGPRITGGGTDPAALPGCVPLADELARGWVDAVVGGEIVVLLPEIDDVGPLLPDNSTATIAMMPIAAAPIPA
jgi:hypothetical protein